MGHLAWRPTTERLGSFVTAEAKNVTSSLPSCVRGWILGQDSLLSGQPDLEKYEAFLIYKIGLSKNCHSNQK